MLTYKEKYKQTYKELRLNGFTQEEALEMLGLLGPYLDVKLEVKRKELEDSLKDKTTSHQIFP